MKNEISSYLENIALVLLGVMAFAFPLLFSPQTTDPFGLPKQVLMGATALVALLLWSAKMISDGKIVFRRTPFDLPVIILTVVSLVSAILSINQLDSLIAFVPFFFAVISFYILVNVVRTENGFKFIIACLTLGASLTGLLAVLSFFKIYALPIAETHDRLFTPMGSLLDQALLLAVVLPIPLSAAWSLITAKKASDVNTPSVLFGIGSLFTAAGLVVTVYELLFLQKPTILPFETGFQTAFAAISQDAGRVLWGFLFGSGFGTYITDFMRFKQVAFNANTDIWNATFVRSSSFLLELLATTGFLGAASFVFLVATILRTGNKLGRGTFNPLTLALLLVIVASFVLPLSFTTYTLLFVVLGIYAAAQSVFPGHHSHKFFDVELQFVASKKSFVPFATFPVGDAPRQSQEDRSLTKILPVSVFILLAAVAGFLGFFTTRYVMADMMFQNSLVAASKNNGLETYNLQTNAITLFPYRDVYHRVYSQVNINLANSIAAAQPKGSSPSAEVQNTVATLIQQGINAGRNATGISPLNAVNWQNLSSVYRSLIGFGQNAEQFAIQANQQAIALDPNNPQEYLNLGGLYYQLGQWDNAQRQFQVAISLKPDFANAYYNLGHALEQKGDYANALQAYQAVQQLTASDKQSNEQIKKEIEAVQSKLAAAGEKAPAQANQQPVQTSQTQTQQQPLSVPTPGTQLPAQNQEVKIPGVTVTPTPTR